MSIMIVAFAKRDPTLYVGPAVLQALSTGELPWFVASKTRVVNVDHESLVACYDDQARVVQPVAGLAGVRLNVRV